MARRSWNGRQTGLRYQYSQSGNFFKIEHFCDSHGTEQNMKFSVDALLFVARSVLFILATAKTSQTNTLYIIHCEFNYLFVYSSL